MSEKTGKVLIIDDNEDILFSLRLLLKQHVKHTHTEKNPEKIPELVKEESYDAILLDMNFTKAVSSGEEGFYWLNAILEIDPLAVVVFITAYGDIEKAVKAVKAGATDFVLKPWTNEKIVSTVLSAIKLRKSRLETNSLRLKQKELSTTLDQPFHDLLGTSSQMEEVFAAIQKVAKTEANVLILGENGTGKELVARALHRNSARAEEIFLCVDLGSITETLFESELFGHVKGAFTDAKDDRTGRFEIASGGTLFLDEIGNLSMSLQAKLLTAVEKGEINRVGSGKSIPVDVRHICATNMPIYQMAEEQNFRQDLLYRINTVEIQLPPLRERTEDIPLLANHFLKTFSKKYKKNIEELDPAALVKLGQYNWPGNVRELQHAIERAVILSEATILQSSDFLLSKAETKTEAIEIETYNIDQVEKTIIRKVMRMHSGNISQASKEMGITRASLYRRLEKYGL
ncbi:MAG: sigma-54-dependent Fis family transcriptional regulator [Proteobacteria bacterium]|nr:sigma-54-dependent Fis family transcriptional regulator [Pseudomonadota bacterium]